MKKNEEQSAKKKPKTSAAQLRVQKGEFLRKSDETRIESVRVKDDGARPRVEAVVG
jgi:hypothetical protein